MSDLKGLLQTQAEEIAKLSLVGVDVETITNDQIDGIARTIAPEIIRGFASGIKNELVRTLKDAIKLTISNKNGSDFSENNRVKNTTNIPVKLNSKESSKLLENSDKHTELFKGQLGFLESISDAVNKRSEPKKDYKPKEKPTKTRPDSHKKEKPTKTKPDSHKKEPDKNFKPTDFSEIGNFFKSKILYMTGINAIKNKTNRFKSGVKEKLVNSSAWLLGVDEKSNEKIYRKERAAELRVFANQRRAQRRKDAELKEEKEKRYHRLNPNWKPPEKKERVSMAQILSGGVVNKEETLEDNRRDAADSNLLKKIEENTRPTLQQSIDSVSKDKNQEPSLGDSLMNLFFGRGKGGKGGVPKGKLPSGIPATSKWGKGLGIASKLATPLMVAGAAFNLYSGTNEIDDAVKNGEISEKEGTNKKGGAWGKAIGSVGGALGGAAAGAAIGSVVPVVGTAIGGIIGGVLGSMAGSDGGEFIGENVTRYITGDDSQAQKLNPANYNNSGEVVYEKSFDDSLTSSTTSSNNLNQVIAPVNNINNSNSTTVMNSPIRNIEPSISEYFRSRYA